MTIALKVEVPIASFRQSRAREYAETYLVPPPSTVYGMLLALVGEMDRYKHCGVELAIALISEPEKSTVIRTFRRVKKKDIFAAENARPDYQELLTDIKFAVWINSDKDGETPTLVERLQLAFDSPSTIDRFGGLSLGESRDLVNAISLFSESGDKEELKWLIRNEDGWLTLPYWVDHVASKGTRWRRYILESPSEQKVPPNAAWTVIESS